MKHNKFNWINNDIALDFPIPAFLQQLFDEAEELDLAKNYEYFCVASAIDVQTKGFVRTGTLTQEQWDLICLKYPEQ